MDLRWLGVVPLSVLAACGGSSGWNGTATVTGTVGGISLSEIKEAVSVVYSGSSCEYTNSQQNGLVITLSQAGGHCAAKQTGTTNPDTVLAFAVHNVGTGPQSAIGPGTYTMSLQNSPIVVAYLHTFNGATCGGFISHSGTITLTTVNADSVSGSYSFTFVDSGGTPGALSGTFATTNCALADALMACEFAIFC